MTTPAHTRQISPAILEERINMLKTDLANERRDNAKTRELFLELDTVYTNTITDRDRAWKRVQQLEELSKKYVARIDELEAKQ